MYKYFDSYKGITERPLPLYGAICINVRKSIKKAHLSRACLVRMQQNRAFGVALIVQ
jgi:hypothetical protein